MSSQPSSNALDLFYKKTYNNISSVKEWNKYHCMYFHYFFILIFSFIKICWNNPANLYVRYINLKYMLNIMKTYYNTLWVCNSKSFCTVYI